MKIETPPPFKLSFEKYLEYSKKENITSFLQETDEIYFYWSELKYRPNMPFSTAKEAWGAVKTHRSLSSKSVLFGQYKFTFNLTSSIQKNLHDFDLRLIGGLYKDAITPNDQKEYLANSLMEEAIASSQIEGAATTTDVARDMIKSGRNPRNESEQMIINNFNAIREIETRIEETLSVQLILDIHDLMTTNTSASKYAGAFRNHPIYVKDHVDGTTAFEAPNHIEVNGLVQDLITFIEDEERFVHPIIKASILHFMIGYIHPFGDGNGRTARALFYWFLIKKGYKLLKHISISRAILDSRTSYDKAFLKTEHDDNDLTYFIMYSMKSLRVAFQKLVQYRDRKRLERQKAIELTYQLVAKGFNKRQADLLGYLYMKPKVDVKISVYANANGIVRQTASRDLDDLVDKGILSKFKTGRKILYILRSKNAIKGLIEA